MVGQGLPIADRPLAPRKTLATASQRLDVPLQRARRLFECGEHDWETFCARRDEITEQKRKLTEYPAMPQTTDLGVVRSADDGPGRRWGGC